jgi:hypothetical protein
MIIAGIDEAGYGPILGPLVVGCTAFATPSDDGETPCLWSQLRRHVSRKATGGKKLHINDSKLVYAPASGLKELERGVLSIAAVEKMPSNFDEFLQMVAPEALSDLPAHPWYVSTADETFPVAQEGLTLKLFANGLRQEMEQTQTHCLVMRARVMLEQPLNRMLDATRNKASALFSLSAGHLDYLIRTFGQHDLLIVCDRQGGRSHYGALLRVMFDDYALEIISEADELSEYRLCKAGSRIRIIFREKAETQALPVALASMLAKYLREGLMRRFNQWWLKQVPGIEPTAGYYTDGIRFLDQIELKRKELGIADHQLIRAR